MERVNKYLNKFTKVNSLNEKYVKVCQSPLTNDELHLVVNSLKKNKSPGSESLTPEFYQEFWNEIEPLYMKMIDITFCMGIFYLIVHESK